MGAATDKEKIKTLTLLENIIYLIYADYSIKLFCKYFLPCTQQARAKN